MPSLRLSVSVMLRWLEACLLGVVAWQLAGLFWLVLAPSTAKISLAMPRQGPDNAPLDPLMRWYAADDTKAIDESPGDYSLLAVIAGRDGVAVLKGSDGASVAVRSGGEIQPGSRLIEVKPKGVQIEQNGVPQEIGFPQSDSALAINTGAPSNTPPVKTPSSDTAMANQGKVAPQRVVQLRSIRITRGQMVAALQGGNVAGWDKGLSALPEGGIRIQQAMAQPFMKFLQLNDGDLIKRINQRPLNKLADISLISHYFGQSASVDIDLVRNGTSMVQHYDIQP